MSDIQMYGTTFGLGNTKVAFRPSIYLEKKNAQEYNIVINGDIGTDRDITKPTLDNPTTQKIQYNTPTGFMTGTLAFSLDANNRYWLILKEPDITMTNWAGLNATSDLSIPDQFIVATWTGSYVSPTPPSA